MRIYQRSTCTILSTIAHLAESTLFGSLLVISAGCQPSAIDGTEAEINQAVTSCNGNPICVENAQTTGVTARSGWEVSPDLTNSNIHGYASPFSINRTDTTPVNFFIQSDQPVNVQIFRLGWYGGNGARLIRDLGTNTLVNTNIGCSQPPGGGSDCSTWSATASYLHNSSVPSGIFLARVTPSSGGAGRLVPFVVRDDSRTSDVLLQIPDTTWQAYNFFDVDQGSGNPTFYAPANQGGEIITAPYSRPFEGQWRSASFENSITDICTITRFLEQNGVNVSYITGLDVASDYATRSATASLLVPATAGAHRLFVSAGHDEYWSQEQRSNVARAFDSGVNRAFLTGNTMWWKTSWDNPSRLRCAKETNSIPHSSIFGGTFTGLWSDGSYVPDTSTPSAFGPENSTTGLISRGEVGFSRSGEFMVSSAESRLRFWRHTPFATANGSASSMFPGALTFCNESDSTPACMSKYGGVGYEWDIDVDNGYRPAGLVRLSTTPMVADEELLLSGAGNSQRVNTTSTHHVVLFRHPSNGAVTLHYGSVAAGHTLDTFRQDEDNPSVPLNAPTSDAMTSMRQSLINFFADIGLPRPLTLDSALVWDPITDLEPPTVTISPPGIVSAGNGLDISGTATQQGQAEVAGVEVAIMSYPAQPGNVDFHPAVGRNSWRFHWTPEAFGRFTIFARASNALGMMSAIQSATVSVSVTAVTGAAATLWGSTVPNRTQPETTEVEVASQFHSTTDGWLEGIQFYRPGTDTTGHYVSLFRQTPNGTLVRIGNIAVPAGAGAGWVSAAFPRAIRVFGGMTYAVSLHTESGFAWHTAPPTPSSTMVYDGSLYAYCDRTTNVRKSCAPANSPTSPGTDGSAPETYYPQFSVAGVYYPVDPILYPTASARQSIWPESGINPANRNVQQGQALTLGTQFSPEVGGTIEAIRFINAMDGQYTVRLFDRISLTAICEATASAPEDPETGWRTIPLPAGCHVQPNHPYIAAYVSPGGSFAYTPGYFLGDQGQALMAAPSLTDSVLEAYAGVYSLSTTNMPTNTYQGSSYFVDVVFRH
jgi:hypothetical protein